MNNLLTVLLFGGGAATEAGAETSKSNPYFTIIFIGLIIVIFYFFMIRPQQKAAKKARTFSDSLAKGDKIITNMGMYGKIVEINDGNIVLEIANNVKIKVLKSAITSYQDGTNDAKNSDTSKQKEEKQEAIEETKAADEAIIKEGK